MFQSLFVCVCAIYVYALCMCMCARCVCVYAVYVCVCSCVCACYVCEYDIGLLFSSFKQLVEDTPPSDLLSAEEKEELWGSVVAEGPEIPEVRGTNYRDCELHMPSHYSSILAYSHSHTCTYRSCS